MGAIAVSLDHAILGLLSERPRSGYDLKTRSFDATLRGFWTADQAQIYRTLDRLQEAKLVASTRRRQSGRPDRKVYEITQAGREALGQWLATSHATPPTRDPFLLQLFFSASLTDEELIDVLEAALEEHQSRLDQLHEEAAAVASIPGTSQRAAVLRQTAFDGAAERERALIEWLADCIRAVREGALPGSQSQGIGQRHLFGAEPA